MSSAWHLITCEFPPAVGGVSDHSRVLAQAAAARGLDVHVWAPAGSGPWPGLQVHDTLGAFAASDLSRTGALLDRFAGPRRLVVQWVPHGYGRRGLNVQVGRWISQRAARGDELDVIVHEPFVDFLGRSWAQPGRAVIQRYMARSVLAPARRVWVSIPGWEGRLRSLWLAGSRMPGVLPVPGTIPLDGAKADVCDIRKRLLGGPGRIVGYFGAGGEYAERALAAVAAALGARRDPVVLACLGRGSDEVARRLETAIGRRAPRLHATGTLEASHLSRHLQACDALVQPYPDGVSGRRTTTISALEHGLAVATTLGALSEPYWQQTAAVQTVAASRPAGLADAVTHLLEPDRNAAARTAARQLYAARFDPAVVFQPLFAD